MTDADYPNEPSIPCQIEWKAGVSPPPSTRHQCANNTLRAWFPEGTFHGIKNFQLQFAHTVMDTAYVEPEEILRVQVAHGDFAVRALGG